jgi:nitrogen PTS system EIIA component
MQLTEYITIDRVVPALRATDKRAVLDELAALVGRGIPGVPPEVIARVLADRERLASTGVGGGVAIPHGKLDGAGSLVLGLARSLEGVDFESIDGKPARLFFVLLAPSHSTGIHLKALARISRLCKEPLFAHRLLEAREPAEMLEVLEAEDGKFKVP